MRLISRQYNQYINMRVKCKLALLNLLEQTMPQITTLSENDEYSCAATPQIRQTGNRLSGLAETVYASLLAQCFV